MNISQVSIANNTDSMLRWEPVMGWARTRRAHAWVARPHSVEECIQVIQLARERGLTICPRGGGFSYSDIILNDGNVVLDTTRMNQILGFDVSTGRIRVEPGVTLAQILHKILPFNWVLPACAGGMGVTIGGAVSNNIHGKDAWRVGNFGEQVVELNLLMADGTERLVSRQVNPELFRAVFGGMGLLGIVTEVTIQCQKILTQEVGVTTTPARCLEEMLDLLEQARMNDHFAVSWMDAFAKGKFLGRGFVTIARWGESSRGAINSNRLRRSLTPAKHVFGCLPAEQTWKTLRPLFGASFVRFVNEARYYLSRFSGLTHRQLLFPEFNFMHNGIPGINRVYDPHGFLEFQPLVPRETGAKSIRALLELCQQEGMQSLLCGMKMHRKDDFILSYSGDGYSFGIDIALRGRKAEEVDEFSRKFFSKLLEFRGKLFLAKDEKLHKNVFAQMYPAYCLFLDIKRRYDSNTLFASNLYERLLA